MTDHADPLNELAELNFVQYTMILKHLGAPLFNTEALKAMKLIYKTGFFAGYEARRKVQESKDGQTKSS